MVDEGEWERWKVVVNLCLLEGRIKNGGKGGSQGVWGAVGLIPGCRKDCIFNATFVILRS
jgi:hypothetical protein